MDTPNHRSKLPNTEEENIKRYDWRKRFIVVNIVLLDVTLGDETCLLAINTSSLIHLSLQYHPTGDGTQTLLQDSFGPGVVPFDVIQFLV